MIPVTDLYDAYVHYPAPLRDLLMRIALTDQVGPLGPARRERGMDVPWHPHPVGALLVNVEDGVSLSEFVGLFPGVAQEQARLVLKQVARSTTAAVS